MCTVSFGDLSSNLEGAVMKLSLYRLKDTPFSFGVNVGGENRESEHFYLRKQCVRCLLQAGMKE